MSKHSGLRPGQPAPASGQYQKVGQRGGKGPEVTAIKGKPLPPTPKSGETFRLVDRTKHKK